MDRAQAIAAGCRTLVRTCADLKPGESALVITDPATSRLGLELERAIRDVTGRVEHVTIPPLDRHGQEPPADVAGKMLRAAVIFGLPRYSLAHSQARLAASQAGARYLSLPDYSFDILAGDALQVDFRALSPTADALANILTAGRTVRVTTARGTDFVAGMAGRAANAAPGWCAAPGTMASPPDAETNIALLETDSAGTLVVDGSIPCPELGLLAEPLTLELSGGRVQAIRGPQATILEQVFARAGSPLARVAAEFGVGLNPRATLTGAMLEDEGCCGTIHIGIGSNATIGGANRVGFHLDHVVREPTVTVDGREIIHAGRLADHLA